MPYQTSGVRRNNVQLGVGQSIWTGSAPTAIPERVFDGLPGCLTWLSLLLSVVGAVAFPRTLLLFAVALALYSALRFALAGIANVIGLRKIKQWEATNWRDLYRQTAPPDALAWDDVHHVVIIPNYKEPENILRKTLDCLAAQYEAQRRMTVVLAMEASEETSIAKAEMLIKEYAGAFAHIYYTVHPRGLPSEMQCKSANEAWAARWVRRQLVDELGYCLDHILVTTMDADTLWHPQYFYALTHLYAVNPERSLRFWQGPIRYHGNIWEINPLMRLINAYSSAFELAYLAAPWMMPMPMSSYSLSLRLLESSGYWDPDVIADEWHMFIKSFFLRDGAVKLERVFLPFLAQATTGSNFLEAVRNRYQQTLRHAWGTKEVGYTMAKLLEHPEIEVRRGLRLFFRISHDIFLAGAGWVIITAGSQLPLLLNSSLVEQITVGDDRWIFYLLQIGFALVSILGIVFWAQDVVVRPPRTKPQTLTERLLTLISFPLLPVMTVIFVSLPTIQAQTRLLMGVPLQFRVTKKA
ncbi:MAG: hypothetical protein IPK19_42350 [Chloroflexi bacterium]|nr:hypothetical protein [Chloroflexota bacterium]